MPTLAELSSPMYKERKPSVSEQDFFRRSRVPGYAADDGNVVINPVPSAGVNYDAVRINEYVRQLIRSKRIPPPRFAVSDEQYKRFSGYGSEADIKATIAGRFMSGDPSAGTATPDQQQYIEQLRALMR